MSGMPSPRPKPRPARLLSRDIVLIMAATFCFMSASMLASPIIAGFAGKLGADGTVMGLVAGALSLTALFCRPVAGRLADRTSKRRLAIAGGGLYVIANVWYACCTNAAMLLCARILNGVGFACISVCLSAWLAMLLPIERMGAGMGLYGTMNALAQAVGPDLGIRASATIGYRPAFLIAAALGVAVVVLALCIRDAGHPPATAAAKRAPLRLRTLFEPRVVPIAVIFMMFGIPYFANQSFLVNIAAERHMGTDVSVYFPIYAVVLLAVRILLRNWFDTKSFAFWMVTCTVCNLGMLACLTFMRGLPLLAAAAVLTAGSYGLMSSVTQATAVTIAGKERSGMANTTYYAGIDLGMFVGPLIGGVLYQSLPDPWFYPLLALTMPVAWAIWLPWHARQSKN